MFGKQQPYVWSANQEGLAVRFSEPKHFLSAMEGRPPSELRTGWLRMQMLLEAGDAKARSVDDGIFLASDDAVRLDNETRSDFALPPPWPGGFRLQTKGVPQLASFSARIGLVTGQGHSLWNWKLRGPILQLGTENYLLTAAQYAALRGLDVWRETEPKDERVNLALLVTLREAHGAGCLIELEAYKDTVVTGAREVEIQPIEEASTGDLLLVPIAVGDFPALDAEKMRERLHQLSEGKSSGVLRVGSTIVVLSPEQLEQQQAIARSGRVPASERPEFERNPAEWLADHVFPDSSVAFGPRVRGVGEWRPGYLRADWEEPEDWFDRQPGAQAQVGGEGETGGDACVGPSNEKAQEVEKGPEEDSPRDLVPLIFPNDEDLEFGSAVGTPSEWVRESSVDWNSLLRSPKPHQRDAVRWLLSRAERASILADRDDSCSYPVGGLLADDMGLGKTFSTLAFLGEWVRRWQISHDSPAPAVLVVAPLSLLANWEAEIGLAFAPGNVPFSRVMVAHPDRDLHVVRRAATSRDRAVPGEVREFGLGYGDGTSLSIDQPGGCVLTTYQTLRDYRFSFAKAEWGVVVVDEAQHVKNPNTLQTIAVKALKSTVRVTLTGTPVENHLGDLWSIVDATEPGPLGSYAEFRKRWILPMKREPARMAEIGDALRRELGDLMMRRTKADVLDVVLPPKEVQSPAVPMTAEQEQLYDSVLAAANESQTDTEQSEAGAAALASLWQIRQVSLHPDLLGGGVIETARNSSEARGVLARSGKLAWLLQQLDVIRRAGEKVLIFCIQKRLQESLAINLGLIYEIEVPVINGDTKASSKRGADTTRLGLIDRFSARSGFGVCVASPIAAGTGLNIVAANHVVHLERHWNPAKEDQATDRTYRMGQELPVSVYLPMAAHSRVRSFDDVLHGLIDKKRSLQGALGLVPCAPVAAPELIQEVLKGNGQKTAASSRLDSAQALRLSWRLFEALVAELYRGVSERVLLTSAGSDRGCDVVVLGFGPERRNLLLQCKQTKNERLDSEVAVREVEGARPYYENALGVTFSDRLLHTTAAKIGRKTRKAAEISGVQVRKRDWLERELRLRTVTVDMVLRADGNRERV